MAKNVLIRPLAREQYDKFMARGRVLFFSAPCGCGKSTLARALLSGCQVLSLHAGEPGFALPADDEGWEVLLIDDLQQMTEEADRQALCQLIREYAGRRFVLLSRGAVPGWLMAFQYAGLMAVLDTNALLWDREDIRTLFHRQGTPVGESVITEILRETSGYPLGVAVIAHCMADGRPYSPELVAQCYHEVFFYFEAAVYRRFDLPIRRFLLELAPFESFDVELARMVSGDPRAGERLGWLQQNTTMLRPDDVQRFRFWPQFRTICATTWEAAFKVISSGSGALYPIENVTDGITYNGNGNVTINLAGLTINELKVTKGRLTIVGNGTVTKLEVTSGAKVELSGGTYGEITGVTDKNTLLGPGYVFDTDGKTVVEAPIKSVTASVTAPNNAKYGYTAEQAPVLTAAITPAITPDNVTGVTYQWYKVNGSKKTAIDNATAQTYTVETGLNAGDYDYCCTATVGTYSLTSGDVTVTIKKANGPQLGTINVNQVYNDTASKTIEIYDQVIGKLNEAFPNGGTMEFQGDGYESADGLTLNGWQIDVNSGSITYTMGENTAPEKKITIKYKAFAHGGNYKNNYEYAEGTVVITLTKITPTGTPNYTPITSSGKTLADAHLNADNKTFSVPGTVKWVGETDELDPSTVPVEKDKAYTWKFTPLLDNYESITGSIILWTESGSGAVIIITPPEQTTDNTTNPATGAAAQPALGLALLAVAAICVDSKLRRQ